MLILCKFNVNLCEKHYKKKTFYGRTDRQTDGRTTQNYSSEPHKTSQKQTNLTLRKVGRI